MPPQNNNSPIADRARRSIVAAALPIGALALIRLDGIGREGLIRYVDDAMVCLELFPEFDSEDENAYDPNYGHQETWLFGNSEKKNRNQKKKKRNNKAPLFAAERPTSLRGILFGHVYCSNPHNRCVYVARHKVRSPYLGTLHGLSHDVLSTIARFEEPTASVCQLLLPFLPPQRRAFAKGPEEDAPGAADALPPPPRGKARVAVLKRSEAFEALAEALAMGGGEVVDVASIPDSELNATDSTYQLTLLGCAIAFQAPVEVIGALCARGANPTLVTGRSSSPLHTAFDRADIVRATALLAHVANPVESILSGSPSPLKAALTSRKAKSIVPSILKTWLRDVDVSALPDVFAQLTATGFGFAHEQCRDFWVEQCVRAPTSFWMNFNLPHMVVEAEVNDASFAVFQRLVREAPLQVLDAKDTFGRPLLHVVLATKESRLVVDVLQSHPHLVWAKDATGKCGLRRLLLQRGLNRQQFDTMLDAAVSARESSSTPPTRSADEMDRCLALCDALECSHRGSPTLMRLVDKLVNTIVRDASITSEQYANVLCKAIVLQRNDVVSALLRSSEHQTAIRSSSPLFDGQCPLGVAVECCNEFAIQCILDSGSEVALLDPYTAEAEQKNVSWARTVLGAILRSAHGSTQQLLGRISRGWMHSYPVVTVAAVAEYAFSCWSDEQSGLLKSLCPVSEMQSLFAGTEGSIPLLSLRRALRVHGHDQSAILHYFPLFLSTSTEDDAFALLQQAVHDSNLSLIHALVDALPSQWVDALRDKAADCVTRVTTATRCPTTAALLRRMREMGWIMHPGKSHSGWRRFVLACTELSEIVELLETQDILSEEVHVLQVAYQALLHMLQANDVEAAISLFGWIVARSTPDVRVEAVSFGHKGPLVHKELSPVQRLAVVVRDCVNDARRPASEVPFMIVKKLVCDVTIDATIALRFAEAFCATDPLDRLRVGLAMTAVEGHRSDLMLAALVAKFGSFSGADPRSRGIAALLNCISGQPVTEFSVTPDDVTISVGSVQIETDMGALLLRCRPELPGVAAARWPTFKTGDAPVGTRRLCGTWIIFVDALSFEMVDKPTTAGPVVALRLQMDAHCRRAAADAISRTANQLPSNPTLAVDFAALEMLEALLHVVGHGNPCAHYRALHYAIAHWQHRADVSRLVTAVLPKLHSTGAVGASIGNALGLPAHLWKQGYTKEATAFASGLSSVANPRETLHMQCLCIAQTPAKVSDTTLFAFMAEAFPLSWSVDASSVLGALARAGRVAMVTSRIAAMPGGVENTESWRKVIQCCASALRAGPQYDELLRCLWDAARNLQDITSLTFVIEACTIRGRIDDVAQLLTTSPSPLRRALDERLCRVALGIARWDVVAKNLDVLREATDEVIELGMEVVCWPWANLELTIPQQAANALHVAQCLQSLGRDGTASFWRHADALLVEYVSGVCHNDSGDVDRAVTDLVRTAKMNGVVNSLALLCNSGKASERLASWIMDDLWRSNDHLNDVEDLGVRQSKNGRAAEKPLRQILLRRGTVMSASARQTILDNAAGVGSLAVLSAFADDARLMDEVSVADLEFPSSVPLDLRQRLGDPQRLVDAGSPQRTFFSACMDLDAAATMADVSMQLHVPPTFTGEVNVTHEKDSRLSRRQALTLGVPPALEQFLASPQARNLVHTVHLRVNCYADVPVAYSYAAEKLELEVVFNPTTSAIPTNEAPDVSPDRWRFLAPYNPPLPAELRDDDTLTDASAAAS